MAITKIHPIKTTLNLSIDYICSSEKTDEEILISTYKCGHKTAALQFSNTKNLMNSQSKNLARHLIQSFMPDEVTPDLAHQIGIELCHKHLNEKYEYVLTTHVDRGHIHNHIIFNNVSYIDGQAYISNKKSYHQIREQSDAICKIYGLSTIVINKKNKINGVSYKEHVERKNGSSYKAKLQYTIDSAIKKSNTWDEFLKIMIGNGYEIKYGKHISFKAVNQERFTRSKTIGENYTEDSIKKRIDKTVTYNVKSKHFSKPHSKEILNISSSQLAAKSEGFARWLKLHNLKKMSKTWNEITENSIIDISSFEAYVVQANDEFINLQTKVKDTELKIDTNNLILKNIKIYNGTIGIYNKYRNSSNKENFYRNNETEIILNESSSSVLSLHFSLNHLPSESQIIATIDEMKLEITEQYQTLHKHKKKLEDINQLRRNLEIYLKKEYRQPTSIIRE